MSRQAHAAFASADAVTAKRERRFTLLMSLPFSRAASARRQQPPACSSAVIYARERSGKSVARKEEVQCARRYSAQRVILRATLCDLHYERRG